MGALSGCAKRDCGQRLTTSNRLQQSAPVPLGRGFFFPRHGPLFRKCPSLSTVTQCIRSLTVVYTTVYTAPMFEVIESPVFQAWMSGLRDAKARKVVMARIARVALGTLGDWKPTQGAVSELRIDFGPGYRVYFTRRGRTVILLLCGGDKRTQAADIKRALAMADELEG